jgi:hypothetical protein
MGTGITFDQRRDEQRGSVTPAHHLHVNLHRDRVE